MENEIEKVEQTTDIARIAPGSPAAIMMELASSNSDFDIEKFGKMLEFQERFEANEARKVYASDFAAVQSKIEAVVKAKFNPQTKSNYAGLDGVIEMAKPVYTKQGFSIIYYEGETGVAENIRVCADVLHKAGHKETYHYDVPLGGVGIQGKVNMTKIHAKATSVTYGRRYLLCMIWNIPTQDDDGNGAGNKKPTIPKPSEQEQKFIDAVCEKLPKQEGKLINNKKVGRCLYAKACQYPKDMNTVDKAVEYIVVKLDTPELYVDDNRSQFEIDNKLPGDEDSTPDPEPSQELRFYCKDCDNEFDNLTDNGLCPNCLGNDLIDRKKS